MFKEFSFNDDVAVFEVDNRESIVRDPKDDTNETLVNTLNDGTKDEFEVNLSISLFITCSFLSKEMK